MERVQKILNRAVETNEVAGANLLVIKEGQEFLYCQAGYADREKKREYKRDTIVRLYSMSKPVTAAAVMLLMERGALELGQAVAEFLPGFAAQKVWEGGRRVPVYRDVNIKDLLNMTSGLPYGGDVYDPCSMEVQRLFDEIDERLYTDHPMGTIEIANRIGECGLSFQPGEKWMYGTSADILAAVVEVATGMKYSEFLQKEFFAPLGMEDTGFFVPKEKQERLATVYERVGGELIVCPTNHLGIMYTQEKAPAFESGGAGLVSTLDDYAKFAGMLLNEGSYGGRQYLSPATVRFMTQAKLKPRQQEAMTNSWDGLSGYTYGNLLRIMEEPGLAYFQTFWGEYGWDGWLGAYFCNSPVNQTTILMSFQRKDTGTIGVTRRVRDALACLLEC